MRNDGYFDDHVEIAATSADMFDAGVVDPAVDFLRELAVLAQALAKPRPGGVLAFITSRYRLDRSLTVSTKSVSSRSKTARSPRSTQQGSELTGAYHIPHR